MAIQQSTYEGLRELALFAGAGGGILGGKLLGWRTVCAVEREAYPAQVLAQRQNDGILEPFPIWSDVSTFDGRPWRGCVDVVSGGFPCQDISSAGRGAGITGERSGLWSEMARIISEVRPRYAFMENSPLLVGRGLAVVISDLAEMGYDAVWGIMGAADVGAPHKRRRIWILGYSSSERPYGFARHGEGINKQGWKCKDKMRSTTQTGLQLDGWRKVVFSSDCDEYGICTNCNEDYSECECIGPTQDGFVYQIRDGVLYGTEEQWWSSEPDVGRVADGMAFSMDRLKAIGNGQVPIVAARAFVELHRRMIVNRAIAKAG